MSELEIRQTDDPASFDLYADGKEVGYIIWLAKNDHDPEGYVEGWCAELWGSSLWHRSTDNHPDIKVTVAAARELNDERAKHEAEMSRIDRNRPRTVTIPPGGQPK